MKYYSYNWATGEYTGADEADPDPLQPGSFIIPAYSTTTAIPELLPGNQAVFNKETGDWKVERIPVAPETFRQHLAAIPYSLVGDETIGDLFNG